MKNTCKNKMKYRETNRIATNQPQDTHSKPPQFKNIEITSDSIEPKEVPFPDMFKLVGILAVIYMIFKTISEHGFLMKIPLSTVKYTDIYWTTIIHALNTFRNILFYHLKLSMTSEFLFILSTEGLASYVVNRKIEYIYFRCWSHIFNLVYDMKLYSFAMYRRTHGQVEYSKYFEFLMFPVLVFRDNFKRKPSINYRRVFIYTVKFILTFFVICFFIDQLVEPSVCRLYRILKKMKLKSTTIINFIENSLALSVSTILMFLMFFKIFFDYLLSIICELNRLDHKFFDNWWNSRTAADFWRTWNIEFHEFAKIHIYLPLRKMGIHKSVSSFLIFLISGLIHEYALSMTVKSIDGLFLLAMIGQVPFYFISAVIERRLPKYANLFFLACFSGIGQPLVLYMIVSKYHRPE